MRLDRPGSSFHSQTLATPASLEQPVRLAVVNDDDNSNSNNDDDVVDDNSFVGHAAVEVCYGMTNGNRILL